MGNRNTTDGEAEGGICRRTHNVERVAVGRMNTKSRSAKHTWCVQQ